MTIKKEAESFYKKLLSLLLAKKIPFMVGGTYAFTAYTDIKRPTKDFDIISTFEDYPKILKIANDSGFETEISEEAWIAKVHSDKHFVDVIFAERNGLRRVDKEWLKRARDGTVLGLKVKLVPIEELIRSKAFIQHRERYDGADVVHLILKHSKDIDWKLLLSEMEPHWEILLEHLLVFTFVYPSEKKMIPQWLWDELLKRAQEEFKKPSMKDRITRGLLISSQYTSGVTKWGYKPTQESQEVTK